VGLNVHQAALIGVDWGTSSFRAFLMDGDGNVLESKETDQGVLNIEDRNFLGVLEHHINGWLERATLPVIISGMVTSRNGWIETPYVCCPAGVEVLASNLTRHVAPSGLEVHLVSGLTTRNDGVPDVIRGEEVQIAGVVADGIRQGMIILPGTHSKWLTLADGIIKNFATFMTGEIFDAIRTQTILGRLMSDGPASTESFKLGVEQSKRCGAELLHTLFSVRTLTLFDEMAENQTPDYLSGLLIGAEIQGAIVLLGDPERVWLAGRRSLLERYQRALELLGVECIRTRENIAALGHHAIARATGLVS
jgi:2-dehydro-3-deoxygalactonokinase